MDNKLEIVMEKLESPDGFIDWLKSLDPTNIVGNPSSSTNCPVVRYILHLTNDPYNDTHWEMGYVTIGIRGENTITPKWYRQFMEECWGAMSQKEKVYFTAGTCLELMERVLKK